MPSRPARSTMTDGPQAATAAIRWDATLGVSARSNSPRSATTAWPSTSRMLRSTSSMTSPRKPGESPGPAADSLKPDVDGRRGTRAGYLAKTQHHMLPASRRHSPAANTICHRGPGQQLEVTTGELTVAIPTGQLVTILYTGSDPT